MAIPGSSKAVSRKYKKLRARPSPLNDCETKVNSKADYYHSLLRVVTQKTVLLRNPFKLVSWCTVELSRRKYS